MWCVNGKSQQYMHSFFGHMECENNIERKFLKCSFLIFSTGMKTTLIYPATKQHIAKYSEQEFHIVQESGEDYKKVTLPYIKKKALSNKVIIYCVVLLFKV